MGEATKIEVLERLEREVRTTPSVWPSDPATMAYVRLHLLDVCKVIRSLADEAAELRAEVNRLRSEVAVRPTPAEPAAAAEPRPPFNVFSAPELNAQVTEADRAAARVWSWTNYDNTRVQWSFGGLPLEQKDPMVARDSIRECERALAQLLANHASAQRWDVRRTLAARLRERAEQFHKVGYLWLAQHLDLEADQLDGDAHG